MMIVETTKAEQQQRLRHDDNSGSKLTLNTSDAYWKSEEHED